jgi:hypothetical protein
MNTMTLRKARTAISGAGFACAIATAASLVPIGAIAQGLSLSLQSHKSSTSSMSGIASSPGMGSSSGTGLPSQGSSFGRSSGSSAGSFGSAGGPGSRGPGSAMGSGAGSSQNLGSNPGGSSSGRKASKMRLKLKPASEATANSAPTRSVYDYTYGADSTGRDTSLLYKSPTDTPPTDNYRYGAADRQ